VRDGHIRPAYSFMWARGPSANRLLIFHLDRDRYWPALACGDDIFFYYKTVNTRRHRLKQPKFVLRCTQLQVGLPHAIGNNNRSLPGHVSLHTTDYRGIADAQTT